MDDLEIVYVLRRRIDRLEQKLKSLTNENVQNNNERNKQTVARISQIEGRLIKLKGIHKDTVNQVYSRLNQRMKSAPVNREVQMRISRLDIGDTITTFKIIPISFKLDDQKSSLKDIIYPTDGTDRNLINTIARYRTIINKSKDFRREPLEVNENSIETVIIGLDTFARQYGGELSFTNENLSFSHGARYTACGIVNLGSAHLLATNFIPTAKFSIKINLNYDRDLTRSETTMKNFILHLHEEIVHILRCRMDFIRIFSIEKIDHRHGMIRVQFGLTTPEKNQTESLARHFQTLVRRSDFRNEKILRSIESKLYSFELKPTLSYLQLTPNDFHTSHNYHYTSTNQSQEEQCANYPYHRPTACFYHALQLSDKYSDDHNWCARENIDGEWPIAFHGTSSRPITDNQNTDRTETTETESCLFVTTHCDGGADAYTTPFTVANGDHNETFRMIFQCRVKPNSFTTDTNGVEVGEIWRITDPNAVRPDGILLKNESSLS